jgi:hypothetical protein
VDSDNTKLEYSLSGVDKEYFLLSSSKMLIIKNKVDMAVKSRYSIKKSALPLLAVRLITLSAFSGVEISVVVMARLGSTVMVNSLEALLPPPKPLLLRLPT